MKCQQNCEKKSFNEGYRKCLVAITNLRSLLNQLYVIQNLLFKVVITQRQLDIKMPIITCVIYIVFDILSFDIKMPIN